MTKLCECSALLCTLHAIALPPLIHLPACNTIVRYNQCHIPWISQNLGLN
jgi:hypothetical protein